MLLRMRYGVSALFALAAGWRPGRALQGGIFASRNFRRLWVGEGVSLLGTHFQVVALSWLVLQLTNSGLALGTILMSAAIARTVFVLIGGALVDRLTPRVMMLAANIVRAVCIAVLTALVALDAVQLWHLHLLAFVFGLMGAAFQPAYLSLVPRLVGKEHVPAGNAVLFATSQLSGALGPVVAGYIISAAGIVTAFGLDAVSFLFAAGALAQMQPDTGSRERSTRPRAVLRDIGVALHWVAHDPVMRPLLIAVAIVNLLLAGPLSVGLPVLAHARFAGNATALGTLLSALGSGALLGTLLGGRLRGLRQRGRIVLGIITGLGLLLAAVGLAPNLVLVASGVAGIGLLVGFVVVLFFSWLQLNTEQGLMGRVMSLVVFAAAVLIPISHVAGGAIADRSPELLFLVTGGLITLTGLVTSLSRPLRTID